MAKVILKNVCKIYESREKVKRKKGEPKPEKTVNEFKAVDDFNLEIEDNEFIVFVGPSGCGKSTTLRMIAGLESISSGEIYIGDRLVNDVEPKDRDIAMVFQNYALYPHLTVYDNIALGLKLRKVPKEEINKKVHEAAKVLDIENLLNRKPKEMSGGQRQRVALGRAMVRNPKVFLLDEPLSNLDAKLRAAMRVEISALHKKLNTTFIYVTHDQVEAMTMGDRIVVMKLGVVQQIDSPNNLFDYPCNVFVAGFIGTPQMNFFKAKIKKSAKGLELTLENGEKQTLDLSKMRKVEESYLDGEEHDVILGVRGEHIQIADKGIPFDVSIVEALGSESHVYGRLSGLPEEEGEPVMNTIKTAYRVGYKQYDKIFISFKDENVHLFDSETERSILQRP